MTHDKYSTWNRHIWHPQKMVLYKRHTLCSNKKCPKFICQGQLNWVIFKRKFLNLLYDPDSWSWDFKVKFFPLQSDILFTLLCLIAWVCFFSRVLVVLQKNNNIVAMPLFMLGAICVLCKIVFLIRGVSFL